MKQTRRIFFEEISSKEDEGQFKDLFKAAKGVSYDVFLNRLDGFSNYTFLYRGGVDGMMLNYSFMAGDIEHARGYGDTVDGVVCEGKDILYYNDRVFNELRENVGKLREQDLMVVYAPFFKDSRFIEAMGGRPKNKIISIIGKLIRSDLPYSQISQNPSKNDLLIPIMLYYAKTKGKNIIGFLGGDYYDYGGADEYVVNDISKHITLSGLWQKANT